MVDLQGERRNHSMWDKERAGEATGVEEKDEGRERSDQEADIQSQAEGAQEHFGHVFWLSWFQKFCLLKRRMQRVRDALWERDLPANKDDR
jgi:hypothetical protein